MNKGYKNKKYLETLLILNVLKNPKIDNSEIDYLINSVNKYFIKQISRKKYEKRIGLSI